MRELDELERCDGFRGFERSTTKKKRNGFRSLERSTTKKKKKWVQKLGQEHGRLE